MNTQPEALRLADALSDHESRTVIDVAEAAAELRRLHAVNQELLEALKEIAQAGIGSVAPGYAEIARAAIAKAEAK